MPVILDCDAAYEDIMALQVLLLNSNLKLVTVTYGESTPRIGARNIERVCRALLPSSQCLVAYGEDKAIDENSTRFPEFIEAEANTILNGTDIPELDEYKNTANAVKALRDTIMQSEEQVLIVATGPLTNIAQLLQQYPESIPRIKKIVIMGGAIDVAGNITDLIPDTSNLLAEWNIYADRTAASIVFKTPNLPILLVPIDVTRQMPMTRDFIDRIGSETDVSINLISKMLETLRCNMGEQRFYGNLQFWDSLSAMIALDESMVRCDTQQAIAVSLESGKTSLVSHDDDFVGAKVQIARELINPDKAYERFIALCSLTKDAPGEKLQVQKFPVFIGLPGSGKSTATMVLQEHLNQHGAGYEIIITDDFIVSALQNRENEIVKQFCMLTGINIDDQVFSSSSPTGAFINLHTEDMFRWFEEMVVLDLIQRYQGKALFDLGDKVPFRKAVIEQLKARGAHLVYLDVSHETIIERLSKDNAWKDRGIYLNAQNSGSGWIELALKHRQERTSIYQRLADTAVDADGKLPSTIAKEALRTCGLPLFDSRTPAIGFFSNSDRKKSNIEIVKSISAAWWKLKSRDELGLYVADDAEILSPIASFLSSTPCSPVDRMFTIMEYWLKAFPDNKCTWLSIDEIEPGIIVVNWQSNATHTGEAFCGVESSECDLEYSGRTTYKLRDGKLVGYAADVDIALVKEQLLSKTSSALTV